MADIPVKPDEAGEEVTLDKLTQSFAPLMGEHVPEAPSAQTDELQEATQNDADAAILRFPGVADTEEAAYEITPRRLLEAMLFVGSPEGQLLSAERAAGVMRGVTPDE